MDYNLFLNRDLRISHRHGDGSRGELRPVPHDPAALDAERTWSTGRLFRCDACADEVLVEPPDDHAGERR